MVFYFSGTGNSKYVAQRISEKIGDELVSINEKIKQSDFSKIASCENLVFVAPTYAWQIPHIVSDWISKTSFSKNCKAWFVMTCGGEIGNAAKYNKKLCDSKEFSYMGTVGIVMPENYIAMFSAPEKEEAKQIISNAEPKIEEAAELISQSKAFSLPRNNLYDKIMSSAVNAAFYPFCVKAKAFTVKESCIGCGKCVDLCPLGNITLENSKPTWKNNCTHCMACICYCPVSAIEYGKKSVGQPRYTVEATLK